MVGPRAGRWTGKPFTPRQAFWWGVVLATLAALVLWTSVQGDDDDPDCSDYRTQPTAQAIYDQNKDDPYDLDRDGDGIACERLPAR